MIGLFLTAMGIGSFLSRFITRELLRTFLLVEILVGLVGGVSALLLFFAFAVLHSYLPLAARGQPRWSAPWSASRSRSWSASCAGQASLRATLGNVLALDYLGALAASLLFPLLLVPYLGLVRTGFLFGLLNVAVALLGLRLFRGQVPGRRAAALGRRAGRWRCCSPALVTAGRTTTLLEDLLYDDPVIYARTTPYQRLVITRWRDDLRLFIDGNIQFSSADEFRYHEALVHPAMSLARLPARGCCSSAPATAWPPARCSSTAACERVDLVDLDPEMTRIFSRLPLLLELNRARSSTGACASTTRTRRSSSSASAAATTSIIIDLPDPNNEGLGQALHAAASTVWSRAHLAPGGVMVTQATSPFYATEPSGASSTPWPTPRRQLPSGAARAPLSRQRAVVRRVGLRAGLAAAAGSRAPMRLEVPTRYLTQELLPSLFVFPGTSAREPRPSTGSTTRCWSGSTIRTTGASIASATRRAASR